MRNAVLAQDPAGLAASEAVFAARGSVVDALLAAALASAIRASEASLLGSLTVLLVGPGVGACMVDGQARAPGLGAKRKPSPEAPPDAWRAVLPGFLQGVLTTHTRLGTLKLSHITREVGSAVRAVDKRPEARARARFVEVLGHEGVAGLERLGLWSAMKRAAGVSEGGLFTARDLRPEVPSEVLELHPLVVGDGVEVLQPPKQTVVAQQPAHQPPEPPEVVVDVAVGVDHRGVVGCACWVVAPTAAPLPELEGLGLAALLAPPKRDVPRWRPGTAVFTPRPLAVLRTQGRAWASLAVAGLGELERARDAVVATRLSLAGVPAPEAPAYNVRDALTLWAVSELEGADVRTSAVAL